MSERDEAEALLWAEYRNDVQPNRRNMAREVVAFKAGFDAGVEWQAGRDAERIRDTSDAAAGARYTRGGGSMAASADPHTPTPFDPKEI